MSTVEIKLALWLMKLRNFFGKRFENKISLSKFIHRSIVLFEPMLIELQMIPFHGDRGPNMPVRPNP